MHSESELRPQARRRTAARRQPGSGRRLQGNAAEGTTTAAGSAAARPAAARLPLRLGRLQQRSMRCVRRRVGGVPRGRRRRGSGGFLLPGQHQLRLHPRWRSTPNTSPLLLRSLHALRRRCNGRRCARGRGGAPPPLWRERLTFAMFVVAQRGARRPRGLRPGLGPVRAEARARGALRELPRPGAWQAGRLRPNSVPGRLRWRRGASCCSGCGVARGAACACNHVGLDLGAAGQRARASVGPLQPLITKGMLQGLHGACLAQTVPHGSRGRGSAAERRGRSATKALGHRKVGLRCGVAQINKRYGQAKKQYTSRKK